MVSILGVVIFCLALLLSVTYGVTVARNNPSSAQNPYQAINLTSPVLITGVVLSWCGPILNLVGLGLAIPAVVQKKDKKTFGIIGLVISALVLLSFCLLTVFGTLGQLSSL